LSNETIHVLSEGPEEEAGEILRTLGSELLVLVDSLIRKLDLPPFVTIAGSSLGNMFLSAMLYVIQSSPANVQECIKSHVKGVVIWG
jgi:hypothetical protein